MVCVLRVRPPICFAAFSSFYGYQRERKWVFDWYTKLRGAPALQSTGATLDLASREAHRQLRIEFLRGLVNPGCSGRITSPR